jgi:hypothetical protein
MTKAAQMTRAAEAIKTMNEAPESTTKEALQEMWGTVAAAATGIKRDFGGEAKTTGRTALTQFLNTQENAKYSGLMPPRDRTNTRNAQNHEVQDNMLADAMHRAYRESYQTDAASAGERSEVMSNVRKFAKKMLSGDMPSREVMDAFGEYVKEEFGPKAGAIKGALANVLAFAKTGDEKGAATGKTDLYGFLKEGLKKGPADKADDRVSKAMALVIDADALAARWDQRGMEIDARDIPPDLMVRLKARIEAREASGMEPHSDMRELLQEELSNAVNDGLREHFKTSPEEIKQAIRDMEHALYGHIPKELGSGDSSLAREMTPAEAGVRREESMNDEKTDYENENGLSIIDAGHGSEIAAHDAGRPLSGHPTAEDMNEGYHGELGTEKFRLQQLYAPQTGGSKPTNASGGYAEIDHVNILDHVRKMKRNAGESDDAILNSKRDEVAAHEAQRASKLRTTLEEEGVDTSERLNFLNTEYNRAMRAKKDAYTTKEPWEVFDAVKALKDIGTPDLQARQLNDLYWADVRSTFEGTGREFFEKFRHSYATSRNMAGGHEGMNYYDMSKGNLTDQNMRSRGIKEVSAAEGIVSHENAEGNTNYSDVPRLMEHALGKVRTREEGIDEMGNKERYDDNLYLPDGKVNERYATDMRSAFSTILLAMLESKDHKMTAETRDLFLRVDEKGNWVPPTDLLLKRGVNGEGDVTLGDVLSTEKPVQFDKKQRAAIVRSAEGVPAVGRAQKGLLWGSQLEPLTKGGKPVVVDTRALIEATAKALGVDMKGATADVHFALLNEGIATLRRNGAVDNLPMPTSATRENRSMPAKGKTVSGEKPVHTLNNIYKHVVLGDRPFRQATDKNITHEEVVSGTPETLVTLDKTGGAMIQRLGAASRFSLDAENRSIGGLEGFVGAIEAQLGERGVRWNPKTEAFEQGPTSGMGDPVKLNRLAVIEKELGKLAEAKAEADGKGRIDKEAERATKGLKEEYAKVQAELTAEGMNPSKRDMLSEEGIARARTEDKADYEENGKPRLRESLDNLSINQLVGVMRNVAERAEAKRGRGEESVFVPDDGTTGRHEVLQGQNQVLDIKNVGKENAARHDVSISPSRSGQTIPVTTQVAERATIGKTVSGDLKLTAEELPVLRKALTKDRTPVEPDAPKTRKADANLQRMIDDISAGKPAVTSGMKPEAIKAWHEEAAKLAENASDKVSSSAKAAMRVIEGYAKIEGVDHKTGEYIKEQQEHRVDLVDVEGAKNGKAEVRSGGIGEDFEIVQNGKVVGTILSNAKTDSILSGDVLLNISRLGQKHVVDISAAGKTGEMPVYEGNRDVLAEREKLVLKQNSRIEQGEAKVFKSDQYRLNIKMNADLNSAGKATRLDFNGVDYSPKRFAEVFGDRTLKAAERVMQAKSDGKEPAFQDMMLIHPEKLKGIKQGTEGAKVGEVAQKVVLGPKAEKYSNILLKDGTEFKGEQATEVIDKVNDMFNGKFASLHDALYDAKGNHVAGKTVDAATPNGFAIQLSMAAKSMLGSTGMHESLHGLFKILGSNEQGKGSMEKLTKSLTGAVVQERLAKLIEKLPMEAADRKVVMDAIKSDKEEAAAYAFQFWSTGALKLGPEGHGFFAKIGKMIRGLLGVTQEYERSEAFMTSFLRGELGKADFKPSALEKAFAEQRGDRVIQSIKEHAEPAMKVIHTVFDSSVKAMERLNIPEATELMRKYTGYGEGEGYIKRVTIESRKHASAVQRIMDAHKPEEIKAAIAEIYSGKVTTEAGKAVQEFVENMNAYAGKAKGELPTIWDFEKISANRKEFDAAIADFGIKRELVKGQAVLDIMHDMGYAESGAAHTHVEFMPQYQLERAKWIQTDPHKFMRSLIVQDVKRTEYAKIFKAGDVKESLDAIRIKGGDEAYHKAKDFVDGMEGKLGSSMSPAVRKMMSAALTVGNVVTLPFALFSASVDPFHLAARSNNIGEAASAYAAGVGSIFKSLNTMFGGKEKNSAAERFAEDIGAIEHSMMTDVLGDIYLGDHAEGWTKRVNDWFFKANMLDGWTRQMRVAAVTAGQRFIMEHSTLEGKHSKRFMEELGLKAGDVKIENGGLVVNDKIKMALNKFVDESIVRPDQATNAIWMNDPRFMLLSHMKRFTYAFTETVLNRSMREMTHGNMTPVSMLMASMPAIMLADMGKHFIKGDYDTWMSGKSGGKWFEYGMSRAGMNGKLQFGLDAVHDAEMGGTPFDSAMGPDLGLVRKMVGEPHHAAATTGFDMIGLADGGFHAYQGTQAVKALKQSK